MSDKKQFEYTYGLLRILACFFVIFHHFINTNIQFVESLSYANAIYVLDNFLMCNNGLFFLISGKYALANYRGDIKAYYKNKFNKIVLPFLLMSLLYYCYFNCKSISDFRIYAFISDFLSNSIMGYFWFIYEIIGFYLIVPFVQPMLKKLSKKEASWLAVIMLVAIILKNASQIFGYHNILTDYPFYHLTFMFFGYFVSRITWSGKREIVLYLLTTIAVIVSSVECIRFRGVNPALNDNCLTRLIMCIGVFVLVGKRTEGLCRLFPKAIRQLSSCTYDIYLMHYIGQTAFMTYGWKLWCLVCKLPAVIALFLGSVIVFIITWLLSCVLGRLKKAIFTVFQRIISKK